MTLRARALRGPLRRRSRPVGLRDERLRARQVRAHAGRARRPSATRAPSRRAARSASSPRCSPHALRRAARGRHRAGRGRRRARAPRRPHDHVRVERRTLPERVARRPLRPRRLLRAPLLLGPPHAERALRRDRRVPGPRRAPDRGPLPPAVERRSADRRRRPRAAARAPGAARTSTPRPTTSSASTSSTHEARAADRHRRGRPGRAEHRAQLPRGRRRRAGGDVCAEPHLPYNRPPLTKELLRGELEPATCRSRTRPGSPRTA